MENGVSRSRNGYCSCNFGAIGGFALFLYALRTLSAVAWKNLQVKKLANTCQAY